MPNFLDTIKRSFVDVTVNKDKENAINTSEFLEAAESLTTLFDVLGSVAFQPVKNDMLGNIKKIRDRQLDDRRESETLQELVVNELKTKKHVATEGLIWLVRFELSVSFRNAYGSTLKPHHSFLVKPIFSAATSARPSRKDFYVKLGDDQEAVHQGLTVWLKALETQVAILKGFLDRPEAKW
ncbi:hypothetical protein VE04_03078 [Pseudogymnoascus sp. 24MN13]|nr:hypothetical protein VE04_03078 [Pseudogymnoascus sp. 24MN13]